ncbi:MAG TPA: DUF4389 domain-containing protein [Gemmatimonadaceae bacterium]
MSISSLSLSRAPSHPVHLDVQPALEDRNRLTTAFRIVLAVPHLLLVGAPVALTLSWSSGGQGESGLEWGAGGVLGAAAAVVAILAWFAILFTGRHPEGLWSFAAFYLRWRVRAVAYMALLRDEYPPFGDGAYAAALEIARPEGPRDRVTVAFRPILAIPQILAVWLLGIAWAFTTVVAWFAILLTGRFPEGLARFGVGVLRWNTRVEAYLLLLRDEYPPFSLE